MPKATVSPENWDLIPHIIRAEKKLQGSIKDLMIRLRGHQDADRNANKRDWVHDQILVVDGDSVQVRLRVCGNLRCAIPESWSAAIIVYSERVDGICHHVRAPNGRGGMARGWHRHEWDPVRRSCKNYRNELPGFDPMGNMEAFILRCCAEFGVTLEEEGGGQWLAAISSGIQ